MIDTINGEKQVKIILRVWRGLMSDIRHNIQYNIQYIIYCRISGNNDTSRNKITIRVKLKIQNLSINTDLKTLLPFFSYCILIKYYISISTIVKVLTIYK